MESGEGLQFPGGAGRQRLGHRHGIPSARDRTAEQTDVPGGRRLDDRFGVFGGGRAGSPATQMCALAVSAADIGVAVTDGRVPGHPIVMVNAAFERLAGYSAHEVIGRELRLLRGAGTDPVAADELQTALFEGRPADVTLLTYRKDGSTFWNTVSLRPVYEEGVLAATVSLQRDVTEQRRAEQALQATTVQFEALARQVSDLVIMLDAELIVQYMNPAAAEILGYAAGELYGKSLLGLVHPDDRRPLREHVAAAGSTPCTVRVQRRDSTWHCLEATIGILPATTTPFRAMITAREISGAEIPSSWQSQLLLQATISGQEEERQRICLEIHDGICQTLTTALRYMEASSQPFGSVPADNAGQRRAQELVRLGMHQAREIVASLRPARLEELGLVAALRHDIQDLAENTGIATAFEADTLHLPSHMETALYRIVHEALNNTIKHAHATHLSLTLARGLDELVAVVQDNGRGFVVDAVESRHRDTGIGLISMRRRTELLAGKFEVRSAPGEGTTVTVTVPLPSGTGA